MLRNNDQRDAGITQDEVLDALKRLGRPHFNKRLLTHFSNEAIGLLPKLRRTSRPGSNKPIYVWDEDVLEQIIELYDLTQRGCRDYYDRLFSLWIRGYEVPFQRAQQTILQLIESQIQDFTQGEEDHEEALCQISTVVATRLLPKWKYSPQLESKIRRLDLDAYARSVERFLDLVLIPTHEQDEFDAAQDWQRVIQEVLSLPRLRDAAMNATMEEWHKPVRIICDSPSLYAHLRAAYPVRAYPFMDTHWHVSGPARNTLCYGDKRSALSSSSLPFTTPTWSRNLD